MFKYLMKNKNTKLFSKNCCFVSFDLCYNLFYLFVL